MNRMEASQYIPPKNRYPGVKPFQPDEKELFFGRAQDIENLHSLIFVKQTVVLYGKSGYGKSSLINAGIIPRLREENKCVYFSIRFNNFSERGQNENLTPIENIKLRINQDSPVGTSSPLDILIPNEDSFWYWIKTHQYLQKKSLFILFFDQFEELFTYPKSQVEDFSEQLSQLLYSTIPGKFRKRLSELDQTGSIDDELHEFLYDKPEVKVVFSVRSDRLSQINALRDQHPSILQNCYELDALTKEQAWKAIIEPAFLRDETRYLTPSFSYTGEAVEKILDNVSNQQDAKIELATLQIVCRYVEDELVNEKKNTTITSALLGDISAIFKQYYEGILHKLNPYDRFKAAHLIEDELLEGGRRNPLPATYIQNKFGLTEELLQQLEATSLLRKERDATGRILIELSHDALIAPITAAKQKRLFLEEQERTRIENEAKRKLETEKDMLERARELGKLTKKGLQLNKSETLKRQQKLFFIQANLKLTKANVRRGFMLIGVMAFVLFCIIWSVISTYKYIRRDRLLEKNAVQLEKVNSNMEMFLKAYDSTGNPTEYQKLHNLFEEYKALPK